MNKGGGADWDPIGDGWQQIMFQDKDAGGFFDLNTEFTGLSVEPEFFRFESYLDQETGDVVDAGSYIGDLTEVHYFLTDIFIDDSDINMAQLRFHYGDNEDFYSVNVWVNAERQVDELGNFAVPVFFSDDGPGEFSPAVGGDFAQFLGNSGHELFGKDVILDIRSKMKPGRNRIVVELITINDPQTDPPPPPQCPLHFRGDVVVNERLVKYGDGRFLCWVTMPRIILEADSVPVEVKSREGLARVAKLCACNE